MIIDYHISLGNILTFIISLGGFFLAVRQTIKASRDGNASVVKAIQDANTALDKRVTVFESVLGNHAAILATHVTRMEKQDALLVGLVGDIQRLLGRIEGIRVNTAGRSTDPPQP